MKKLLMHIRTSIKLLSLIIVGTIIIIATVILVYKPIYSVSLNGDFIGYTETKSELQSKINDYIKHGDYGNNIAFVQIEELPKYKLCLLKRGNTPNDNEIYEKVKATGTTYYKFYAITESNEEKHYVSTFAEAEEAINTLTTKKSANIDNLAVIEKYETELKEFTTVENIVTALYQKPKVTYTYSYAYSTAPANTTTQKIDIGISFIQPTSGSLSSRYGARWGRMHSGIDISAPIGTPIYAAASGTITFSGWNGGYGNLMVLSHGNGIQTCYAHCTTLYVGSGESVSQGQLIGTVGSTGNSTGPHLHFEVRINGAAQNPQNYVY